MEYEPPVRSTRRSRPQPQPPEISDSPAVRSWLIYGGMTALVATLMIDGLLDHGPRRPPLPALSQSTDVKSAVSQSADSLQVVVSWDLTLSVPSGRPDSIRVRVVGGEPKKMWVSKQPANQLADTVYLPPPPPGQTGTGTSCVAALHAAQPPEEKCTPWQYVRPASSAALGVAGVTRVVIEPSGLQVDPDVGGKCAEWQRTHPTTSVWIAVNRTAVAECTGPNTKPTVAQFCAFAVLPDGKKVKSANSAKTDYCDELFVEWTRERYS